MGKTIQVRGDGGIGDHCIALCAAAGLRRDRPGDEVVFAAHPDSAPWCALFDAYDRLVTAPVPADYTFHPYSTWQIEYADPARKPRWEHYARACGGTTALLPAVRPLPDDALEWASQFCDAVLLAPWSNAPQRDWLLPNWRALESALAARGVRTFVLDYRPERAARLRSPAVVGESAVRVAAALCAARGLVANDSGLAHVAGLLRRPAVALCGPVSGYRTFGLYPAARWLDGVLPCTACYWRGENVMPACHSTCASQQGIRVEDVLAVIKDFR